MWCLGHFVRVLIYCVVSVSPSRVLKIFESCDVVGCSFIDNLYQVITVIRSEEARRVGVAFVK